GIRDPAGPVPAELAVDDNGTVTDTSYESRYPVGGHLGILVPQAAARLPDVLNGWPAHGVAPSYGGTVAWAMYPVVAATGGPRGAEGRSPPLVLPALTGVLAAVALMLVACALLGMREAAADHARVAERDRIARELHDSISQELFAVRMTVSALEAAHAGDVE